MTEPIVSVIIPTYRRSSSLIRAINSVLNQTLSNLEVIVVDDNNKDSIYRKRNEQLMKKYINNEKIVFLKHESNQGVSSARNTGAFYSKSKYIAFLDDDDEFLQKKLEMQIALLEKLDDSWGGVYCGHSRYRNGKLFSIELNLPYGNLMKELLLMKFSCGFGSNLLIKMSIFNELKGFDTNMTNHEDWELLVRFFRKYKIGFVNQNLVKIHTEGDVDSNRTEHFVFIKKQFLEKCERDIGQMPISLQSEIYKRHYLEICKTFIRSMNFRKALHFLKLSNRTSKLLFSDYINILVVIIDILVPFRSLTYRIFYFLKK